MILLTSCCPGLMMTITEGGKEREEDSSLSLSLALSCQVRRRDKLWGTKCVERPKWHLSNRATQKDTERKKDRKKERKSVEYYWSSKKKKKKKKNEIIRWRRRERAAARRFARRRLGFGGLKRARCCLGRIIRRRPGEGLWGGHNDRL